MLAQHFACSHGSLVNPVQFSENGYGYKMIRVCCQHHPSLLLPWAIFLKEPGFSGLAFSLLTYDMKVVTYQ